MADTKLFVRHQIGGMFSVIDRSFCPGRVWWVDSTNTTTGSDAAGYGEAPDKPLNTIEYALGTGFATASRGDHILCMPGHIETIASAAALDIDVIGASIIGLGTGNLRPQLTFTAQASTVEINATSLTLENILFIGGFTNGTTVAVDVKTGADDLMFKNCEWRGLIVTQELLTGVTIEATISRVTFDGCRFKDVYAGGSAAAIATEGAITDLIVKNCEFDGDWSAAAIDADATAITTPQFRNLLIRQADGGAGLAITIDAATIASFHDVTCLTQKANTKPISDTTASFVGPNVVGTDAAELNPLAIVANTTAWA